MTKKIGFIVGSLREDSYNLKVAKTTMDLLPEGYEAINIEVGDLALYNEDIDKDNKEYERFRTEVKTCDAIVVVTPEYNRSMSAVVKNAIDVGSRPYNDHCWTGKKVAVMSASQGATGGMAANYDVRRSLSFLGAEILAQPEMMFSNVADNFDDQGEPTERTNSFVKGFVDTFVNFIG